MRINLILKSIFGLSFAGMSFSGYLSYGELIKKTCSAGGCSEMLGIPVCIYGFIMYTAVFVLSLLALKWEE